jgi:hypothetical protein
MGHDELLNSLIKIPIELEGDASADCFADRIELWGLSEQAFEEVTRSSCNHVVDGTGTRPYDGALIFLQFCRAYPNIFLDQEHRLVELGAGIGVCGLMLAMARKRKQQEEELEPSSEPSIFLTDGEALTVEIARRNRSLLGLTPEELDVTVLQWSEDSQETRKIARLHSFQHVIGTDLLYYMTPARALLITAEALLARQLDSTSAANDEGAIFLPAIIRTPSLSHEVVDICRDLNLTVHILPIESFCSPSNPFLYNLSFLIITRQGAVLQPALQEALDKARLFDPNEDSDDDAHLPFSSDLP